MKPVYVYIAGPLSAAPDDFTRYACRLADQLLTLGYVPFVPHLTLFWEQLTGAKSWDTWLTYDEHWLRKCDALLRFPGISPGADREEDHARDHGIAVVYSIDELTERFPLNVKTSEPNCGLSVQAGFRPSCDVRSEPSLK